MPPCHSEPPLTFYGFPRRLFPMDFINTAVYSYRHTRPCSVLPAYHCATLLQTLLNPLPGPSHMLLYGHGMPSTVLDVSLVGRNFCFFEAHFVSLINILKTPNKVVVRPILSSPAQSAIIHRFK